MTSLLDRDLPLIAAPMAGGVTTPALVTAAERAGGLGLLPAGYLTAEAFADQIAAVRSDGSLFGVNLFVPGHSPVDQVSLRRYADRLAAEAAAVETTVPQDVPHDDDDAWHAKLEILLADPVPVVSTTFGLAARYEVRALQRAGSQVWATVTSADEARAAAETGADALIVQGPAAGGHSGTHTPARPIAEASTVEVVQAVRSVVSAPIVAAGGVDGPESVRDLIAAGAEAVSVGTLLVRSDESGATATYRDALVDPRFTDTIVTTAFTGRPARALRNGFVDRQHAAAPHGYPAVHHLTRPLRQAAARRGDADRVHLWAGTGYRRAQTGSAATILKDLARAL